MTIFGAIAIVSFILTSCGGGGSQEPAATSEEPAATSEDLDNSSDNSSSNQSEPTPTINVWGCNQCSKVLYQHDEPDNNNCPVGYTYNGGSGSTHNWKNYGEQGNDYYSCEFCGLNVQVNGSPNNGGQNCNSHEYGQALTSDHHWVK